MSQTKAQLVSGTTAQDLTVDNINTTSVNSGQASGRKNIVINGAMQVNQRASSYTATNSNEYTLDRFLHAVGSGFNFDTTTTQDSSSPDGFSKSLKITPDATVTPSAGENGVIDHFIEGQDLQSLAFGTSSAKSITISFYAKSASANSGDQYTLMFQFVNGSGNRFIKNKAFTVTSSWQRYSVTFTGNTSESIITDHTVGGRIVWILTAGPDDIASEKSSWTDTDLYTAVTGQSNFMDNTSNEFFLTGVQLEIGSTATDFEHRSFGDELALCQRYTIALDARGSIDNFAPIGHGRFYNGTDAQIFVHLPTTMRLPPTIDATATTAANTFFLNEDGGFGGHAMTSIALNERSFNSITFIAQSIGNISGQTVGLGTSVYADDGDDAKLVLTAEL